MNAQPAKTNTARVLRPSRLNLAGWCLYCFTRGCTDARCIVMHARSVWAICSRCDGSEYSCQETLTRCDCVGGLIEIDGPDAEVIELTSYAVTYPARPDDESRRLAGADSQDYGDAIREALTEKAHDFDRRAAAAPLWDGDGSDVWF